MFEIDSRGRFKRNGWAAGKVGFPVSDLLPAEEELVLLWEGLRERARDVRGGMFLVTASVQSPDPPLASALVTFTAPKSSPDAAKDLSFNLLGLEKDLHEIHPDVFLEQLSDNGTMLPTYGLLVRISSAEQFSAATEVMQMIDHAVQETRLGEFVADTES